MEGKIAVLGSADFVMPFSALGLDTYAVSESTEQITKSAEKIVEGKYPLIVVAENIAKEADMVFAPLQNSPMVCIVVVPFTTESKGYAVQSLGEALRMATGINILQNN